MKKLLLILWWWVLSFNLTADDADKFNNYFHSEIEFFLLEDYRNVFSNAVPKRFYRSETDEYLEFIGVYQLKEYDDIHRNFFDFFQSEKYRGNNEIWFERSNEKGIIKVEDNLVWIKYIKKNN